MSSDLKKTSINYKGGEIRINTKEWHKTLKIVLEKLKVPNKVRLLRKEKKFEVDQIVFLATEQKNKEEELCVLLKII